MVEGGLALAILGYYILGLYRMGVPKCIQKKPLEKLSQDPQLSQDLSPAYQPSAPIVDAKVLEENAFMESYATGLMNDFNRNINTGWSADTASKFSWGKNLREEEENDVNRQDLLKEIGAFVDDIGPYKTMTKSNLKKTLNNLVLSYQNNLLNSWKKVKSPNAMKDLEGTGVNADLDIRRIM